MHACKMLDSSYSYSILHTKVCKMVVYMYYKFGITCTCNMYLTVERGRRVLDGAIYTLDLETHLQPPELDA